MSSRSPSLLPFLHFLGSPAYVTMIFGRSSSQTNKQNAKQNSWCRRTLLLCISICVKCRYWMILLLITHHKQLQTAVEHHSLCSRMDINTTYSNKWTLPWTSLHWQQCNEGWKTVDKSDCSLYMFFGNTECTALCSATPTTAVVQSQRTKW